MIGKVLEMLDKVKGAQFARFTYRNEQNELARHILLLGVDYEEAYKKDVATLEGAMDEFKAAGPVTYMAAREILASLKESLAVGLGNNSQYTLKDRYVHIDGLKGVRVFKDTGVVSVLGLVQDRTVIEPGVYPVVKSSAKTLAKRQIERDLRKGKIRTFNLPSLTSCAIAGETVDFVHGKSL